MTSTTPETFALTVPGTTVQVALVGVPESSAAALRIALDTGQATGGSAWNVSTADPSIHHGSAPVNIALCHGAAGARSARATWPAADIVAMVPARDDGTATIAALQAGAQVCVRGNDSTLIAAYLKSIARRRGLITEGDPR